MRRIEPIDPEPADERPIDGKRAADLERPNDFERSTGVWPADEPSVVDLGERDLAPPGYRRWSLPSWLERLPVPGRRAALAVAEVALVAAASASVFGVPPLPWAGHAVATPTRHVSAVATLPPEPSPIPVPTATPTPSPFLADGWPVELPVGSSLGPQAAGSTTPNSESVGSSVGPDGMLYFSGAAPIDPRGVSRPGWMQLPDGRYVRPLIFGSDGSAYGYAFDDAGVASIWAFAPDGLLRYWYSTNASTTPFFEVTASDWLYLLTPAPWANPVPGGEYSVVVLDPDGSQRANWPVRKAWPSTFLVRRDGTVLVGQTGGSGCYLSAYSMTGVNLTAVPSPCWDHMKIGPDGEVVGWSYEIDVSSVGQAVVASTTVAVLGEDGSPEPGWPKVIGGSASAPAFGGSGSIYFTVRHGEKGSYSDLERLDVSGAEDRDWTVPIEWVPLWTSDEAVGGAVVPVPPVVGGDLIFVPETVLVEAFDSSGAVAPGWPFQLPSGFTNALCYPEADSPVATPSAEGTTSAEPTEPPFQPVDPLWAPGAVGRPDDGLLYLPLGDRIVALTQNGEVAPGWPYMTGAGGECWQSLAATPDGGVVATALCLRGDNISLEAVRLTVDGKLAD